MYIYCSDYRCSSLALPPVVRSISVMLNFDENLRQLDALQTLCQTWCSQPVQPLVVPQPVQPLDAPIPEEPKIAGEVGAAVGGDESMEEEKWPAQEEWAEEPWSEAAHPQSWVIRGGEHGKPRGDEWKFEDCPWNDQATPGPTPLEELEKLTKGPTPLEELEMLTKDQFGGAKDAPPSSSWEPSSGSWEPPSSSWETVSSWEPPSGSWDSVSAMEPAKDPWLDPWKLLETTTLTATDATEPTTISWPPAQGRGAVPGETEEEKEARKARNRLTKKRGGASRPHFGEKFGHGGWGWTAGHEPRRHGE